MEIKFVELKKPLFGKYAGITLIPYVFWYIANKTKKQIAILKNHELIHAAQVTELQEKYGNILGWMIFYTKYIYYYLKNLLKGYFTLKAMSPNEAYMNIPYEKEAYANEKNLKYLETREKDAWKKYL